MNVPESCVLDTVDARLSESARARLSTDICDSVRVSRCVSVCCDPICDSDCGGGDEAWTLMSRRSRNVQAMSVGARIDPFSFLVCVPCCEHPECETQKEL